MAMNLAKETFSTERKYFEAGTDIRVTTAVKPAAAALEALGLPRGLALRPGARPGHHPHMTREMRLDT